MSATPDCNWMSELSDALMLLDGERYRSPLE